ncbi:phytanoyl-CoA dioxygenase family protein, partial [Novosphingobium pentaromativorans]|uniref:phytanoyl-CoA dioxygenase family protein n=1 Tax=Novosphingobium pentaromativorans TaxID=205844 RepID=UPI00110FDE64
GLGCPAIIASAHKDTAYVKVDCNPMSMMATWVALEDVSEGTGELEYFVGSHRSPDYVFGSLSKWIEAAPCEHNDFLAALHANAETYGYARSRFLPKAGDVLIWHADLAHGGSAVTKPGLTRRSLVTHYTAARHAPYYRRWSKFPTNECNGVEFVSSYSDVTSA